MSHPHSHNHQHAHSHKSSSLKTLNVAVLLTFAFGIIEAFSGWRANSLALLGDAGHMISDAAALAIAAFAVWIAQKPASSKHSYGLGRAEVIAAWISSLITIIISIAVVIEAIERIHVVAQVESKTVMLIAFLGLVMNLFIAWMLARKEKTINIRAALLHVVSDMLGSFIALISGIVIYFTGWFKIDPILSLILGVMIAITSLRLLRESLLILMEGVPSHINLKKVSEDMNAIADVKAVHDLHIWTLSSGRIALSAHIDIHDLSIWHATLNKLQQMLKEKHAIQHVTLQPEPEIATCFPCDNQSSSKAPSK